jgi:hypothetical protein
MLCVGRGKKNDLMPVSGPEKSKSKEFDKKSFS